MPLMSMKQFTKTRSLISLHNTNSIEQKGLDCDILDHVKFKTNLTRTLAIMLPTGWVNPVLLEENARKQRATQSTPISRSKLHRLTLQ
jgi:hypothetical protein